MQLIAEIKGERLRSASARDDQRMAKLRAL